MAELKIGAQQTSVPPTFFSTYSLSLLSGITTCFSGPSHHKAHLLFYHSRDIAAID